MEKGIPVSFQEANLQLANNVEAWLVQLKVPNINLESSSQAIPIEGATLPAPVAMIGPTVVAAFEDFVAK